MANGGRKYVSKEELSVIESIRKEKQQILDLERKELQNIKALKKAYEDTGDESLRLTAAMKQRLNEHERENFLRLQGTSLEKKLTKQSLSTNKLKKEAGKSASIQLANLKKTFKTTDMTEDSFQSQASIIEQIAAGSASIEEIQETINDLGDDAAEGMKEYLESQKQSLETQKFAKDAMSEFDGIVGGLGGKIKKFITNPITIATAALLTFNATQESIGKQFGAIGVMEFRNELAGANAQFTQLGLSAAESQSTISNLANEFGISVSESKQLSENISRLAVSSGASLDDTTKLVGLFTQTKGLTGDQAANLLQSTQFLANANNVAPDKILGDVAQSTEFFAKFADEGGENILRAAVQARKLGINLQSVEKITTGLLDFQTSLNAENEASVLIGRRLNFQKARELALANDVEGATRAVVEQLGSAEEFNRLNAIQRKALADAAGVEVSELSKIVNKEKEALTLQGALSKQEIKPIPEEVLTQTAQLIGSLQSIGITLAEVLGPPLNLVVGAFAFLGEGLNFVNSLIQDNIGLTMGLAGALGVYLAVKKKDALASKKKALAEAAAKAFKGGFGGPLGIALSIAGLLAAAAVISRVTSMDDGLIGPGGETMVSGPKGSIQLNPQDSMIVGTNLMGGGGAGGQAENVEQTRQLGKQTETLNKLLTVMDGAFGDGGRGMAKKLASGVSDGIAQG